MTDNQWESLLRILDGERLDPPPAGFLVDGPWVSAMSGIGLMDYFTDTQAWLRANLEAVRRFPDVLWIPGFWAEFGMISNPPSFGAKCIWPEEGFPSCETVLRDVSDVDILRQPNVRTDGLLPLIIQRLRQARPTIEAAWHRIRFACSHGPVTIGSYLLGHTEFFLACRTDPEAVARLLEITTRFVIDWLAYQKAEFPSIDGILVLEDLMGFVGERDFKRLIQPCMTRIFASLPLSVRFLHNDAFGLITARHLTAMGVNLFNFSFEHDFAEIRRLAGDKVTLMGNIPPRDVLGLGSPEGVRQSVAALLSNIPDPRRMIVSAGGFTPAGFDAGKIAAFCEAVGGRQNEGNSEGTRIETHG
ncbi:MAG: uroporphyrinogen decarboxylase [Rhodopirellula sp.]|nr:uroporphyrinogen decarboxylase [Rhodopirellula sp.]